MVISSDLSINETSIYDELVRQGCALTAYELLESVRPSGIRSPTQVYRALERLEGRHLVHRIESINAFIACAHSHESNPHPSTVGFAICEKCGNIAEIDMSNVAKKLGGLASKTDFKVEYSLLEFRGKCQNCQTN